MCQLIIRSDEMHCNYSISEIWVRIEKANENPEDECLVELNCTNVSSRGPLQAHSEFKTHQMMTNLFETLENIYAQIDRYSTK
jgi:hypothetical protein